MFSPPTTMDKQNLANMHHGWVNCDFVGSLDDFTDLGNANRFLGMYRNDIVYVPELKAWFYYDGGLWRMDTGNMMAMAWAKNTTESIYLEAQHHRLSPQDKEDILKHAKKSSTPARMKATLELAKINPEISVPSHGFDTDPMLLSCMNGVLDLTTGELCDHNRNMLLTKTCTVPYAPNADCPRFKSFLDEIMNGNQESIDFLQKAFGYSLTGLTREQCLFILLGKGANGKSTLIETVRKVLGDYACHTPSQTLLKSGRSGVRNDIARLVGNRFVSATEIGLNVKLDEATVKQLTGGDTVTARYLSKEYFEYRPEFKLFIAANHLPKITGNDDGIWRRIKVIPFDVTVTPDMIDRDLPEKLEQELPGILTWLVAGCIKWQGEGLGDPSEIAKATADYRSEMDMVASFLEDRCIVGPDEQVTLIAAYQSYVEWCNNNCLKSLDKYEFRAIMRLKDFSHENSSGDVRYWKRLGLK